MPAALMALLRAAIPFMATILGGYVVSDVYNERQAAIQAQAKVDYPAIVERTFKAKAGKWKFVAVAGIILGVIVAFLTKKFK